MTETRRDGQPRPPIRDGFATGRADEDRDGLPQAYHAPRPMSGRNPDRLRFVTLVAAILWLGPFCAYLGGRGFAPLLEQPFSEILSLFALAIVPIILVGVLVELAIQSQALSRSNRQIARLALSHDSGSDARTALLSGSVRRELDRLSGALDATLARVAAIETMIENQVGAVERAGGRAQARAQAIRDLLQQERNRLEAVAEEMSTSASVLVQAVSTEAGRVRQANEIAAREIHEAEGLLSRQMQSFRSLAEESGRSAHERVTAIEAATSKLETAIGTSLKNAEGLSGRLSDQHATLAASATRLEEERTRLEAALEAQARVIERIQSGSGLTQALETAVTEASTKIGATLAGIEARSAEAGRSLRGEVEAASGAGETAAKAIAEAAGAAREAAAGLRTAISQEISALGQSLSGGMHGLDDAAGQVGRTLSEASQNARLLVESLEDTVRTVETASGRLFELLDQMSARSIQAQNAVDNAAVALDQRLGQGPEVAAEHAARLSALLEDQAQRMGALAESLTRRVQPSAPALPPVIAPPAAASESAPPSEAPAEADMADEEEHHEPINLAFLKRPAERAAGREDPHKESGLAAISWIGRRLRRPSPLRALPEDEAHALAETPVSETNVSGFWTTLFARIEGEDSAGPLVPEGADVTSPSHAPTPATRTQQTLETLYAIAIDLDRLLEEDPPMELWKRYSNGEPDAFARRLLTLKSAGLEQRIRAKYREDGEFRDHANRYRQRFGEIAGAATNGSSTVLLSSPAGRLYGLLNDALRPID